MKDKANAAVSLQQIVPDDRQSLRGRAGGLVPLVLLSAGLALWLHVTFPSLPLPWPAMAAMVCGLGGVLLLCGGTRAEKIVFPVAAAAGVAAFALFHKSYTILLNDFFAALQSVSGHIYLQFEPSGSAGPVLVSAVCEGAVLLAGAVYTGSPLWLMPILVLMVEGAVSAVVPFGVGMALFVAGLVLMLARRGLSLRLMLGRAAAVLLCGALALSAALPMRDAPSNKLYSALREAAHGVVYDSRSNAMPEGKLKGLGSFDKNETAALRLTLQKPQALYLRGHIYETYTGTRWTSLSAQTRDRYAKLFYWLHDGGYYGQTQVASALREAGMSAIQTVTLENLSACRAHGYLPYGADGVPADETLIGDADLPQTASFTLYADDAEALRRAQENLAGHAADHAAYFRLEQAFAEYAQKVDLAIPDAARAVLDREFSARVPSSGSLSDVRIAIRNYLDQTLRYDEQTAAVPKDADFLQCLLEDTRAGYSVHYATAAVLLLRYCGVPARYVEGYYLPKGESGTVTVTEQNAHAWAELYLDGIGFVPFEVTPTFADAEQPQPDADNKIKRAPQSPAAAPFNAPPETVQPQQTEEETAQPALWRIILLVVLFGVSAAVLWVVLRRRRLRRALLRLSALPPREAVLGWCGYVKFLRRYAPDAGEADEQVRRIAELAQFSCHTITDAQRQIVLDYAEAVRRACLARWKLPQKLYYRFIRCIIL